ncbi:MAG: carotenoid biosynthesis protein [Gemmatimonadaceae bacterium]|nr:carotenoid biosynthesis protein [Gemmatimonadaceae bacterium]NUO95484.1 carotenoid biosynthesis protein [Gemmatimonadaceae bacterium]NUP55559.1 carotenoid biosynthesis protein [Gemmatimonadaceae bacterium]NUP71960.1 carotenoid biosynthesis protein [Gemmatimonadaceae bacterium]NUR33047.1 carotenoid biosynthesis protein [Gemmatimonadaceae bacterium]
MSMTSLAGGRAPWIERSLLLALFLLTAMAAAGYALFALHPERLAGVPSAMAVYGQALRVFPPAHIVAGVVTLAGILTWRVRGAWLPAAVTLYLLSLASELLGTTVGLPFGPYRYGPGLGIKWLAHVPVLVPASWFMMALPSFALATRWVTMDRVWRIVAAAALLVSWDLALDPAMSRLMPYWIWGRAGPYYGMPLLNLVGWYATGLALMTALALLRVDRWLADVPTAPLLGIYLANLALPVIMAAAAGLWPASLLAVLPLALAAWVARARTGGAA